MEQEPLPLTYIGGPTVLLQWGGLRLLTDPTLDPAGASYDVGTYTLQKTIGPALDLDALVPLDAVLLSHDHHFDNLDRRGRLLLNDVGRVLTTPAGAERLGPSAIGVAPWQRHELRARDGRVLQVVGTPARHGPAHADRGPVTGFVLSFADDPDQVVYISGDTVWYEGLQGVSARFSPTVAILFLGAARVAAAGEWNLTLTAAEAVEAARAFASAIVVPLHFEGWQHLSESAADVASAFQSAGMAHRLRWLEPGRPTPVGRSSIS